MITVTFKDDNGVWAEQMTMKEIAALSTATGVKIVRFESHRERELECCLEDITRTPATITRTLDAIEGQFYELQKFAQKGLDRDPCFTKVIDDIFIKNTLNHQLQAEVDRLKRLLDEREREVVLVDPSVCEKCRSGSNVMCSNVNCIYGEEEFII